MGIRKLTALQLSVLRLDNVNNTYFGLNNIYSQKNTYVNTTQMVQDLTVSAALIYKSSPETNQKLQYI